MGNATQAAWTEHIIQSLRRLAVIAKFRAANVQGRILHAQNVSQGNISTTPPVWINVRIKPMPQVAFVSRAIRRNVTPVLAH